MTFIEVLNNPQARQIVEAIEHGCNDKEVLSNLKNELFKITGWNWVS